MKRLTAIAVFASLGCAADDGPEYTRIGTVNSAIRIAPGGTTCAAEGFGDREFTIQNPQSGTYSVDGVSTLRIGFYDGSDRVFYFTDSAIRMDAVLVHGGGSTAVWDLGTENNGWGSLHAPMNFDAGEPYLPDAVSFCFDYDLFVNPNAYASAKGRRTWDIEKTSATSALELAAGATFLATYDVTVGLTGIETTDRAIDGPIFVYNSTTIPTTLTGLTAKVGELDTVVTCPFTFPYVLGAGQQVECSYWQTVPDGADRMVVATVTTSGGLPGALGEELGSFAKHTTKIHALDTCVDVTDDHVGLLGTVCESQGSASFQYTLAIGPYSTCESLDFANTATLFGHDTGTSESSTWTIDVDVICEPPSLACTLTQGYWKTHADPTAKKYDEIWNLLANGPSTPFFSSGLTYLQILLRPTKGNAYLILAHQYIAAQLNGLAGAGLGDLQWVFDEAKGYLSTFTPSSPGLDKPSTRDRMILLAGKLDAFNNGDIGPGHCD